MILFPLLMSLLAAPDDSIAILRAQEHLDRGDTLQAIEVLQDWSATHEAGRKLTNLLGLLHMPDEPVDSLTESVAVEEEKDARPRTRKWSFRSDEMFSYTDRSAWYLGAGASTGIADFGSSGRRATLEFGVSGCVWNGIDDTIKQAFTPLLSMSVVGGGWDSRLDAWGGILAGRMEAGAMAIVARNWTDSVAGRLRIGGAARLGLVSASYADIFCQAERRSGSIAWSARSDLRLRRDPVDGDSSTVDSLRTKVIGDRIQSASRLQVLFGSGAWSAGPAFDLDLRRSLSSDAWFDGVNRRTVLRQEGVAAAQAVAKFVSTGGRWLQARLGATVGFGGSEIDPGFEDRNTGLAMSVSVGASI